MSIHCATCYATIIRLNDIFRLMGTCIACREQTHDSCDACHNYTVLKGTTICRWCSQYDTDEIKLPLSLECKCGILRSQCEYHS